MFKLKGHKGITLIALVITIIVLLILAGVTVAQITGQDGAPEKAAQARLENRRGEAKEAASVIVTGLVQEYHEKKFVEGTTDATSAGEYAREVLEYEAKVSGDYTVSVENEVLKVEDAEDVLVTGIIQDDGVIIWDGTPRAIAAAVNPWNDLATEENVLPSDLFIYEITEQPQATGKVEGVTENAKVADNSGNIKVADAENLGKAKITGINYEKLAEAYVNENLSKQYTKETYQQEGGSINGISLAWSDLYSCYKNADAISDEDISGTYSWSYGDYSEEKLYFSQNNLYVERYDNSSGYYYVDGGYLLDAIRNGYAYPHYYGDDQTKSENESVSFDSTIIDEIYDYRVEPSNYTSDVVNKIIYSYNYDDSTNEYYWDNSSNDSPAGYDYYEIYRCNASGYDESQVRQELYNRLNNTDAVARGHFRYEYVEAYFESRSIRYDYYGRAWDGIGLDYEEDVKSFTTSSEFNPKLIFSYDTTPDYFENFVIPNVYTDEDGKKYQVTSVDLSEFLQYVGNKIKNILIPNSVTALELPNGYINYELRPQFDTLVMSGGLGTVDSYFSHYIKYKKLVFGEGITEINSDYLALSSEVKEVYLPKSLKNIQGAWRLWHNSGAHIYYAGNEKQWEKITGNKPPQNVQVTFNTTYTGQSN